MELEECLASGLLAVVAGLMLLAVATVLLLYGPPREGATDPEGDYWAAAP